MRQHHALGLAGAARGVLQEGDVGGAQRDRRRAAAGAGGDDVGHGGHRVQRVDLGAQQVGQRLGALDGQQLARAGVAQDAGDAPQVVFQLRGPRRRVQRHGHAAGAQGAVEGGEELAPARQHDRHRLAAAQPARLQAGGDAQRVGVQVGVGQLDGRVAAFVQRDQDLLRVLAQVGVEDVEQGGRVVDGERRLAAGPRAGAVGRRGRRRRLQRGNSRGGGLQQAQQVARGLGLGHRRVVERDAELVAEAGDQLDAGEAVEPPVALDRRVEPGCRRSGSGVQFGGHRGDGAQQPAGGLVGRGLRRAGSVVAGHGENTGDETQASCVNSMPTVGASPG